MPTPTIEYRHHIDFRAVGRLKDQRTGNPIGPTLGHHYRVGLVFVGDKSLMLPAPDPAVEDVVATVTDFIAEHWADQDLTRLHINPTPLALCWYLTEVLGGRVGRPDVLTAVTITVDGGHSYTYRPGQEPDASPLP